MKFKQGLVLRHIATEYVIVGVGGEEIDLTRVYTLNAVAAWLWEELEGKDFTVTHMVELLTGRYQVDQGQAREDAHLLVDDLKKNGLIEE